MSERKLLVEVIATDRVLYAAEAQMVIVPGAEGEIGILPLHVPIVSLLKRGEIRIKHKNHIDYFFVDGGFLEVKEDKVSILSKEVVPAQEIEIEAELRAQEELKKMIAEAKERGDDVTSLMESLEKSLARAKIAAKIKKS